MHHIVLGKDSCRAEQAMTLQTGEAVESPTSDEQRRVDAAIRRVTVDLARRRAVSAITLDRGWGRGEWVAHEAFTLSDCPRVTPPRPSAHRSLHWPLLAASPPARANSRGRARADGRPRACSAHMEPPITSLSKSAVLEVEAARATRARVLRRRPSSSRERRVGCFGRLPDQAAGVGRLVRAVGLELS